MASRKNQNSIPKTRTVKNQCLEKTISPGKKTLRIVIGVVIDTVNIFSNF
jgi:hypothetical protein